MASEYKISLYLPQNRLEVVDKPHIFKIEAENILKNDFDRNLY
jgi:hypothetical protein